MNLSHSKENKELRETDSTMPKASEQIANTNLFSLTSDNEVLRKYVKDLEQRLEELHHHTTEFASKLATLWTTGMKKQRQL